MSLTGAYDPENIFAKILSGGIPSVKVWEDADVLAFMDVFPQSEGHVLVISKTSQARNLLEVEPEVLGKLIAATQRTAKAVTKALEPEGFSIMQFNGEAGGQTVYHLHFHIIPRWSDRPMKGHGHAPMADAAVLRGLADRIAAALD
ncbi:MAG: HIT family protein [Caulobacteraceae bacterium]|nr:HIT family protein [Caulobacteraceae bacterium]